MKVLGIRANPNEIYFAVVESNSSTEITILTSSYLTIPIALNFPEKLNFIRKTFKDIILEYDIVNAGIRIAEPTAFSCNVERISYEAILQELFSNSSVHKYFVGQISNISSKLGIPRTEFKNIIGRAGKFDPIANWSKFNSENKEAILVGIASINL